MDSFKSFILCHRAEMTMHQIGHELNMADLRYDHTAEMQEMAETHRVSVTLPIVARIATVKSHTLMADLYI